jgi:hypothetical protein
MLYDNDESGVAHSNKRSEEYNFIQIFIPDDIAKDISDAAKDFIKDNGEDKGLAETKEILQWILN